MIRLRTLGACVVHVGDAVIGREAERLFAVLLYLVTERGRRTARRTIQDLLWPDATDDNGRHNLRQVIYKLRQYGIELGGGSRDVQLYADQITEDPFDVLGGDAATAGDALLGGELGEYLAGYAPGFSEPYAAWVEAQRAYAHARVARAAVGAMLERRARGRWEDVERLAQTCLRYDPLNEEATLALAEANALAGSKTRALAILDQYIAELGDSTSIQLPATLLRRRIAERLPDPPYTVPSEACFAGRDESLRYLHELFGHARAGRGQSCMVVGEPGVGKSRLAAEFARVATLQGAQIYHMGCRPRDTSRPLSLFVDGVPGLLKMPGAIGCSPRSMSYLKRITEYDPTASTPTEDSREAESLYANVRRSVLDLLDAIVGERTLLLVVEDVHWADAASWDVLRDMIAWCADRRLLLVITSRVAHVPHAALERLPLRLHHLAPLADDAARAVLDALVGERQRRLGDRQHGWLLRAANGNPLFLRELVIHWLETGREGEVPPSLAALLRERLGRLTPRALGIFQTCAAMGNVASFERLELVLEHKRHEVLDGLQELEAAGLLRARGGGVESRHELLAQEATAALAESARTYLHRQVALALEPAVLQSAPGDASLLWACAEHWRQAGEEGRAWKIATACGAYLVELGRPTEAVEVYICAERYAGTDDQRQAWRVGLSTALIACARWGQAREVLIDAVAYAFAANEPNDSWASLELDLLDAEFIINGSSLNLLRRSKDLADLRTLSPAMRLQFAIRTLRVAEDLCLSDEMHEVFDATVRFANHASIQREHKAKLDMIYHGVCGDLQIAEQSARLLVEHHRNVATSAADCARALRNAAYVYQRCGKLDEAELHLIESVELAERHNLITHAFLSCYLLTEQHFSMGDARRAGEWFGKAQRWGALADARLSAASLRRVSAKMALFDGRGADAFEAFPDAAHDVLQIVSPYQRATCEALYIHLRLESGRFDEISPIIDDFRRTLDQVKSFGDQDYPAFVSYLLTRHFDVAAAEQAFRDYMTVYRRERGPLPAFFSRTPEPSSGDRLAARRCD